MRDLIPLLYGAGYGLLGQSLNVTVGLYKRSADAAPPAWDWGRFALTVWMGAAAGILGAIVHPDPLFLVACGYAGVNAIDNIMQTTLRKFT